MPDQDDFLERLRTDAAALRKRPDEATLARIRERIRERIERPTVTELLARWFRPVAAAVAAVAIAVTIGFMTIGRSELQPVIDTGVEVSLAGDTYRVGY